MMTPQIDFVVTWLDSSDPEWQKSFEQYSPHAKGDKNAARFRNLNCFRYWFRAVETYAPWVRKIFLITNGTFPDWINKNHPKLVLVKHEDYMPKECLPTFNSCAIELHILCILMMTCSSIPLLIPATILGTDSHVTQIKKHALTFLSTRLKKDLAHG